MVHQGQRAGKARDKLVYDFSHRRIAPCSFGVGVNLGL